MRLRWKGSLWVLFLLACGVSWFWWNISTQKLSNFIEYQLHTGSGGAYQAEVEGAETGFFVLNLKSLEIYDRRGQKQVSLQNITLSLAPWNLLLGDLQLDAEAYQGNVRLTFNLISSLLEFEFKDVLLNFNPIVRKSVILNGNPSFSGSGQLPLDEELSLEAKLKLESATLNLKQFGASSPVPLPDVIMSEVLLSVNLQPQSLKLDLQMKGDITGSLRGDISPLNWNQPQLSNVNLILQADVKPAWKQKLGYAAELISMYQNAAGRIHLRLSGKLAAPNLEKL